MTSAAERLLPPLQTEDIFKRTKGRVAKVLSAYEKAVGIAQGHSEAVIKIDKASSGIKTAAHMQAAAEYLSRNGKLELETQEGESLSLDDVKERINLWCQDAQVPPVTVDSKRPADARRIILSCPPGTDPKSVYAAAKQLAQEVLKDQGFEYLMVMHYKNKDHPKEPEHPHVHFLIKAVNERGVRLNLRKGDLRYIRERFAVIAKSYGIKLNATPRAVRGQTLKAKTQAQIHQEQSQAQKWAIKRKKSKLHPYAEARRNELITALKENKPIADHPALNKSKTTRQQVLKNIDELVKELQNSEKTENVEIAKKLKEKYTKLPKVESAQQIKLRIAKRKLAEKLQQQNSFKQKQSQAQKWAINNKKQAQQNNVDR